MDPVKLGEFPRNLLHFLSRL
uniref:Uncharacterized protein n=1 Tax=Rhizophora mucronata TaxID=61149 RepID=A0A2P2PHT3_RHIMU